VTLIIDSLSIPPNIKGCLKTMQTDYDLEREGKKGANGYLFFGVNKIINTKVAIKFYYWGGNDDYHFEPQAMASLGAANVLTVLSAGMAGKDWAYFVSPYIGNGDLDDCRSKSSIDALLAIDIISSALHGLTCLHQKGFVHRDLKPDNIFVQNDREGMIGDLGSLRKIPDGENNVPSSGHTTLYRPPESFATKRYDARGDVYQMGVVLYQILGGLFPYDESSWIPKSQMSLYNSIVDDFDRTSFVNQCIQERICKSKAVECASLPNWIPDSLKRIIRKATHVDIDKRYQSACEFQVALSNVRASIYNWQIIGGWLLLEADPSYRINMNPFDGQVYKSRNGQVWRKDNSIKGDLPALIAGIEKGLTRR